MFDDLKIRNKLIVLVAGPLLVVVLLAAFGARSRQETASQSRDVEELVALARANGDVVDALQQESLASTAFVGSDRGAWSEELKAARATSDEVLADALRRMDSGLTDSSQFRSSATLAVDAADKLEYIREAVDQGYRWEQVAITYSALEETFLSVNDTVADALRDPQVAGQLRTGAALASYKAAIAGQGALMVGAAEQGAFDTNTFNLFETAVADESSQEAIFASLADTTRKGQVRDALTSDGRVVLESERDDVLDDGVDHDFAADPPALLGATDEVLTDLRAVETGLVDDVIARSESIRTDAERAATVFLVVALLAVIAAAAAAIVLGRRITRPLNHLTDAAHRLSDEQMPKLVEWLRNPEEDQVAFELSSIEDIEVESKDEIGELAESFNQVQRVAGEVAQEQASLLRKGIGDMFVNLARRNQALLDRQIEFIDELERGEEDPDQLDNLYKLDHLATRMRRNAESLLVLAGAEPPRRRGRPAPLANVVRAALAEVEDFGRIELLSFDEVLIASNVAADLAHLLSELMENATNFSPPETRVEVVGHRTKADGYAITITDHGIGMSNEQLGDANEALAKPPVVGLALSRSLGFIVVGRLAARHGITVRTMASSVGGVTAVVSVPANLITDSAASIPPAGRSLSPALGQAAPEPAAPAAPPVPHIETTAAGSPFEGLAPLSFDPSPAADPATAASGSAPTAPASPAAPASPTGPVPGRSGEGTHSGLPTRRMPAPSAGDSPLLPSRAPAANGSTPEPELPPAAPEVVADHGAAPAFGAAGPESSLPESLVFDAPPSTIEPLDGSELRLDGQPPAAPTLPSRSAPPAGRDRPFFLEETGPPQPPRLFGRSTDDVPAPPTPPVPSTPEEATPSPVAPTPLSRRVPEPDAAADGGAPPAPAEEPGSSPSDPAEPAAAGARTGAPTVSSLPSRTTSGLARRTPRDAAARAMPGADKARGVSATRRSPEEVRNLLSKYRAGQQRGRSEDPGAEETVPATPTQETHSDD